MKNFGKTLFLILGFGLTLISNAQDSAMNSFKTPGYFVYSKAKKTKAATLLENKSFIYKYKGEKVLVVFTDTDHTEYFDDKKYFIKSKISWTSNYECSMTLQESNLPNFPFKKGAKLTMKITKVKRGYIYYDSTLAGKTWSGRMKEI